MDQTTTTPLIDVVDGAVVAADPADQQVTTSTTDPDLLNLVQQISTQQQDYGRMGIIGCGLIIGIMLCSVVRWWR